jgi:hypothetical protein
MLKQTLGSGIRWGVRCIAIVILGAVSLLAQAQTENSWTGTVSNLWDEPGNWSLGHVPYSIEIAHIDSGTVNASMPTSATVELHGGTLTVSGSIASSTTIFVASTASLTLGRLGVSTVRISGTVINHGRIIWADSNLEAVDSMAPGFISNALDGSIDILCDRSLSSISLENLGSITKINGAAPLFPPSGGTYFSGAFYSSGTIAVSNGMIQVGDPRTLAGPVTVAPGAAFLAYSARDDARIESTASFTGAGDIYLDGSFSGTLNGHATFSYQLKGTLEIATGSTVTLGRVGSDSFYFSGSLINHGLLVWADGNISTNYDNTGTGFISNALDGSIDILCDHSLSSPISFENLGTITKINGRTGTTTIAGQLKNSGRIALSSGNLSCGLPLRQNVGQLELQGGSLFTPELQLNGGELSGPGTVNGNVTVATASIQLGGASATALTINGNLTLQPTTTLASKLAGPLAAEHGQLIVTGTASLDGLISVALTNGYTPTRGEHFRILEASSRSGAFSNTLFPPVPTDMEYFVGYTAQHADIVCGVASLADWSALHFGAESDPTIIGDAADPDGDGIQNLLEYAFGLDPLNATLNGLPVTTLAAATPGGPLYLTTTFHYPATVTDITFTPEVSNNLAIWQSGSTQTAIVSDTITGEIRTIIVRDSQPATESSHRFMRIKATLVP